MASQLNYSFAKNSDGILINVSEANREEKYFCPICCAQMTPHLGKVRRWHFVHKNTVNCSYESYLHNLAKIRIREAFLNSEQFLLSYDSAAICSLSCPYKNSDKCSGAKHVEFNLRDFYDSCELEASYHGFRADLLLSSTSNPSRQPVLIEIKVTHKCSEEKRRDGARIIEIPIDSEEQIDEIVKSRSIAGVRCIYDDILGSYWEVEPQDTALFNFNKIEQFDPRDEDWVEYLDCEDHKVFIIDRKGEFWTLDCSCYDAESKIPKDAHYFITNCLIPYKEIFQNFSKRGVKLRTCFLCKFSKKDNYNQRICVLYKKNGLPKKPSPSLAQSCKSYKEDTDYTDHVLKNQPSEDSTHKWYFHINDDIL